MGIGIHQLRFVLDKAGRDCRMHKLSPHTCILLQRILNVFRLRHPLNSDCPFHLRHPLNLDWTCQKDWKGLQAKVLMGWKDYPFHLRHPLNLNWTYQKDWKGLEDRVPMDWKGLEVKVQEERG